MKIATVCYVPPKGKLNSDAFIQNLDAYEPAHDIYLYSDDPSWGFHGIANPEVVKHPRKHFAVNNLCFLFGLNLAIDLQLDYMLYLESDCRVRGNYWDTVIFKDCFREGREPLIYGTPVVFNISQSGFPLLKQAVSVVNQYMTITKCPAVVHGAWPGSPTNFLIFPNGALGIYHVPTLTSIFNGFKNDIGRAALDIAAWDHSIGDGMYRLYKDSSVEKFQYSTVAYSGYGNEMTTPEFRKELLMSDKMVAIHQWKGSEALI